MFKYVALFFFLYIAYQFIFKLVLPLFRATSVMRQQVNQMNTARQQYENQVNQKHSTAYNNTSAPQPEKKKEKEGEYIDFEEL
ncbi:MAG: hypothetical protein DI598_02140 [Pseudopedobacter saltans]|uniref:DUF4834 domain-containing protein n=1 Tax=Pseudopedobacter saltans TaxID=151895 RepID=A0A2W5FDZ2_9SPHI|nr:MAG: hypothetical protein DI598_02140 [Pseudopedobacter saltans]